MKFTYRFILSSCFLLSFIFQANASYKVWVNQEYNEEEKVCVGQFIVIISGDAGPFDITIYKSIDHIYSNFILEQRLGVSSGFQIMNPIEVSANYQAEPVLVITDRFGCEYIYDEVVINCDCEAVYIDHSVASFPNAPDIDLVDGILIYHPTDCFSNDGKVRFVSTVLHNAIPPTTYEWSDPSIVKGYTFHTNIGVGLHTLTVTDGAGCSDEVTINFKAENKPSLSSTVCPSCSNSNSGFIEFTTGTTQFSDEWTIQLSIDWEDDLPPSAFEETTIFEGFGQSSLSQLPPGQYCVTITETKVDDASQMVLDECDHVECFTIEGIEAEQDLYFADPETTNTCPFQATGTFSVFVDGGVKFSDVPCFGSFYDYQYQWSHLQNPTFSPYIDGLAEGDYVVKISDFCGDNVTVEFSIEAFDEMTFDVDFTKGCYCESELNISNVAGGVGNSIDIEVSGPSGTFNKTVQNFGSINNWDLGELCKGMYTVKFTDEEGCYQETEIYIDAYPQMDLEVTSFVNPCLVNTNFFEGGFPTDIIEGTVYEFGAINSTITWSDGQDYSTNSSFEWQNAANPHSGMNVPNINQAMDLTDLGMEDFDGGGVNMPPTVSGKAFALTVCTEFEPGVECCETVSQYLSNAISVRTQAFINGSPNNGFWQESGCDCQLFVYCGSYLEQIIERTPEYKECDVLSDITDNVFDCGEYVCYCDFPSRYDQLDPIPSGFEPRYPLDCPEEQSRPDEVTQECLPGCQFEVECPDWNSILGINWSCNCGPFQSNCDILVSSSSSKLVVSNGGCEQDISFEFEIDLEDVNCGRPLYVTTRINGATWGSNIEIGEFSEGSNSWILDANNSALINQSFFGCGTLDVIFNYDDDPSASQMLSFIIESDDCGPLDVSWENEFNFNNRCTDPIILDFNGIDCPVDVQIYFVDGTNQSCGSATGAPDLQAQVDSDGLKEIDLKDVPNITANMTMIVKEVGSSQCQTFNIEDLELSACLCAENCLQQYTADNIPTIVTDCNGSTITMEFGCNSGEFKVWSINATQPFDCSLPGTPGPTAMEILIANGDATQLEIVDNPTDIGELPTSNNDRIINLAQSGNSPARKVVVEWDCNYACVSDAGMGNCFKSNDDCNEPLICDPEIIHDQIQKVKSIQETQNASLPQNIKFPTHLNRVKFCDQSEYYFFDEYVEYFGAKNIIILDQIKIGSYNDILEIEIKGEKLTVEVRDFIAHYSKNQILLSQVTNVNEYKCVEKDSAQKGAVRENSDSNENLETIMINPNPFISDINVSYLSNKNGTTSIRIYSLSGDLIKKIDLTTQIGKNLHRVEIDQVPPGLMLIQIILPSGESSNFKILKVEDFDD